MKYQPNRNYKSDDIVMTPPDLAYRLVKHFNPQGKGLEPCSGTGNILRFLPNADWCEITKGRNFFDYDEKVDYIFTNPPWSKIKDFLTHSLEIANDIYFLLTINHIWTKARLREIFQNGFGIKEIRLIDTPKEFPQSGFQLGMVHIQKGWRGDIKISFDEIENKTVCPFCGNEMDETYHGRQYCYDCENKLKGN